jgi:predicted dehydrogenase
MSEPLRVGLVGAGGIAAAHLGAMRRHPMHLRAAAICDLNPDNGRRRGEQYGVSALYSDIHQMLADADIEAVDICTSHDQHAELAIKAANAGKHVLVEKPLATSMTDCHRMVEAAERAGTILMGGQCERYLPSYAALRRVLHEGELGIIRAVRFDAMQSSDVLPDGHWLLDADMAGGGVVISVAVHRIDLARFLVGEVKRVSATCRTGSRRFVNGAEDYAVAHLEFVNGAVGEMFATWSALRLPWSEGLMLFGDDGVAHATPCPPAQMAPALVASRRSVANAGSMGDVFGDFAPVARDRDSETEHGLLTDNMFDNELIHFAQCCRSGREPWSSGRDNLGTMATIFAIYESSRRRGEPVELAEVWER